MHHPAHDFYSVQYTSYFGKRYLNFNSRRFFKAHLLAFSGEKTNHTYCLREAICKVLSFNYWLVASQQLQTKSINISISTLLIEQTFS